MRNLAVASLASFIALSTAIVAVPGAADITGKWSGGVTITAEGRTNRVVLIGDFKMQGQAVSGSLGPGRDAQFSFTNGTFDGRTLAFRAALPTRLYKFALTLADKNRLVGAAESEDGKAVGHVEIAREPAEAYTREDFPDLRGPYLGQPTPGAGAERFAPGIVSIGGTLDSVPQFTPDGQEAYWSRVGRGGGVIVSRVENGRWTLPATTPLAVPGAMDFVPVLFAGGRKLLIHSTRALPDGRRPERGFFSFWVATRQGPTWAVPPSAVDFFYTGTDDFSTIGEDGTLYLGPARGIGPIRRASPSNGRYGKPEPVSPVVNGFPVLVGPKDAFLVVARGAENRDLFIMFRKADGSFTDPIDMGPTVNSSATEQFASLSPDGKYFFFSSERTGDFEVYWVDAGFIAELKRQSGS